MAAHPRRTVASSDRLPASREATRPRARVRLGGWVMAPAASLVALASALGAAGLAPDPRPAGAAVGPALEPARMKLVTALVDETLKGLLPITFNLPAPTGPAADGGVAPAVVPATLLGLRYCGASEHGAGRFRAAIRLAGIPATGGEGGGAAPIFGDGDCRPPLGDLGKRLGAALSKDDAAMVLADLEATWRSWEIRLVVARFVQAGEPRAALGWGDGRREVLTFSTAGIAIPTDLGPLTFHVAPTFAADGLELAAVLGESGVAPPNGRPPSGPPLGVPLGNYDAANAVIELPYGLGNHLLRTFTAKPFPVRVGRDTVDVQNATLRGAAGGITVTALASPRAVAETARVTATASGDDLRVGIIRAEAQLESCAGQGMMASLGCNARNAARNAAAATLGAAATDRYQNQLLRDLAGAQDLHFGFAQREIRMSSQLVRIVAASRGLLVTARLTPRENGS